jgi:hypothetical protein
MKVIEKNVKEKKKPAQISKELKIPVTFVN